MAAVMLRPRTDLLADGTHGLTVELCAWSASDVGQGCETSIADFGNKAEVPRLAFHVFRVWEVLPAEELSRVLEIDIDGRIHVRRVSGRLLDLTAYERIEATTLSGAERGEHDLDERVLLVHTRLHAANPALTDEQIGDMYGLGTALFDYAFSMGVGREESAPVIDDGLDGFASAYESADSDEGLVAAVTDVMLDAPGVVIDELRRALDGRGVDSSGLDDAWREAEERLTDEEAWDDPNWDDFG